jgi:hypothetical protein
MSEALRDPKNATLKKMPRYLIFSKSDVLEINYVQSPSVLPCQCSFTKYLECVVDLLIEQESEALTQNSKIRYPGLVSQRV